MPHSGGIPSRRCISSRSGIHRRHGVRSRGGVRSGRGIRSGHGIFSRSGRMLRAGVRLSRRGCLRRRGNRSGRGLPGRAEAHRWRMSGRQGALGRPVVRDLDARSRRACMCGGHVGLPRAGRGWRPCPGAHLRRCGDIPEVVRRSRRIDVWSGMRRQAGRHWRLRRTEWRHGTGGGHRWRLCRRSSLCRRTRQRRGVRPRPGARGMMRWRRSANRRPPGGIRGPAGRRRAACPGPCAIGGRGPERHTGRQRRCLPCRS
jgi:hypothetical protein